MEALVLSIYGNNKYIHWPIEGGARDAPSFSVHFFFFLVQLMEKRCAQSNRLMSAHLWGWRPSPVWKIWYRKWLFHCCTGRSPFKFAQKKLWREAGEACLLAQCLHMMADEYVKASEQYVLPSANQLTRFALPSSSRSAQQLLRELKVISSILHPKM